MSLFKRTNMLVIFVLAALVLCAYIGRGLWTAEPAAMPDGERVQRAEGESTAISQDIGETIVAIEYACAMNKSVEARYDDGAVRIIFGDGRSFTLEQTAAASGVRYANDGDKVVFWSKGTTALVQENGVTTFADCVDAESLE